VQQKVRWRPTLRDSSTPGPYHVIARFEAERQALALMDHPHTARVFEAGTTEAGRSFFVMELVKGVPLTRYCGFSLSGTLGPVLPGGDMDALLRRVLVLYPVSSGTGKERGSECGRDEQSAVHGLAPIECGDQTSDGNQTGYSASAAERPSSAAGPAGKKSCHEKP
jgi:hypothetical protein